MPPEESPWLSIVTVVKDAPADFGRTVKSVVQQDLSGVEYVVVDSSADAVKTRSALEASLESGFSYSWIEPHGIYPAMNAALSIASGEYVYFLNAGDTLHDDDVLRRMCSAIMLNRPVWAFGPVEIVELDGNRVVTPPWDYEREKAAAFSRGKFPPHQGTISRRSTLLDVGGFDASYTIVADYAAFLRLTAVADPLLLDFVVATFVEGGVSTTSWPESLKQFHRARRSILAPRGAQAAREYVETVLHAAAMAANRGLSLTRGKR